jgi:CheY-like chemotaxis protein
MNPEPMMPYDEYSKKDQVKHRILVVDNDIETADLLADLMEEQGYEVEVATEGNYALMLMDRFEAEVILLQLDMPGMSGYDVTQILRTEPRYAQRFRFTRILYLTDKAQMLSKRFDNLPGTPMSDYIFKPIDIPELIEKIRRALGDNS